MEYLGLALLLLGAALLIVGYRKNSRNVIVAAALLLLASPALPDFMDGVEEGFAEAREQAEAAVPPEGDQERRQEGG